jgi:hypothetical protein
MAPEQGRKVGSPMPQPRAFRLPPLRNLYDPCSSSACVDPRQVLQSPAEQFTRRDYKVSRPHVPASVALDAQSLTSESLARINRRLPAVLPRSGMRYALSAFGRREGRTTGVDRGRVHQTAAASGRRPADEFPRSFPFLAARKRPYILPAKGPTRIPAPRRPFFFAPAPGALCTIAPLHPAAWGLASSRAQPITCRIPKVSPCLH